jgi:DNA-directed RNA polymerase delta subunit
VLTRRFHNVGDIVRVGRGTWGLPEWYPNRNFKSKKAASKPESGSEAGASEQPSENDEADATDATSENEQP